MMVTHRVTVWYTRAEADVLHKGGKRSLVLRHGEDAFSENELVEEAWELVQSDDPDAHTLTHYQLTRY